MKIVFLFLLSMTTTQALAENCGAGSPAEEGLRMEWSKVVGARIVKWEYYSRLAQLDSKNKAENREKDHLLQAQLQNDCSKIRELGCPEASTIDSKWIPYKTLAQFCPHTVNELTRETASIKSVKPAK